MTSWRVRVAVSLGLSAYFLVLYGLASTVTARRADVPSVVFGWEHHVPFVPWLIVPYMSIDLFFVAAPLLIRSRWAMRAYALRVVIAVTAATACFLLFPLRFSFIRPQVAGGLGVVFDRFQELDQPFNQLPSLHVALALIVGEAFIVRTRGGMRLLLWAWFVLIAISPLFVYQHHVVDLAAGLALGLICLTFLPDRRRRSFERSPRIAAYYAIGAAMLLAVCLWLGRSAWPLWWPALSMTLVALCYVFVGPAAFDKRDGRLRWTTRLLLGPTLLGQSASRAWYARKSDAWNVLTDRVWIGRQLTAAEAAAAREQGVGAVVDLTCEFSAPPAFRGLPYLHLPTLDLTAPTPRQIRQALAFIRRHPATTVYVHCKAGYSRTAVIAGAYWMATQGTRDVDQALTYLAGIRRGLVVRPEARRALRRLAGEILCREGSPRLDGDH